jgi:aspartate aminotransferase-like enzyme
MGDVIDELTNIQEDYKLLSSGIVRLSKETLNALVYQHIFMHRNSQFHSLYEKLNKKLCNLVTDTNNYIMLLVTGSGTWLLGQEPPVWMRLSMRMLAIIF